MVVGVNCGHTKSGAGYGAVGIIKESEHTRLVGQALMSLLRSAGVTVMDCTIDQAGTQNEYLAASVALANRQELDWFISIHFNASGSREGHGTEVYTYEGRQYQDAVDVCANLSELGFANRGVKAGTGLYVIRKTK
ncbi:MAG: N-acetylmuramoyl-L-alanine amidase, partial [Lachnospiraceae bacterium]|nr:N-acetylmuramoyl-L-alanine amidase [Lachnospiraceae bacterium]